MCRSVDEVVQIVPVKVIRIEESRREVKEKKREEEEDGDGVGSVVGLAGGGRCCGIRYGRDLDIAESCGS